jgi:pimeloyl-ACP methyl ester carboxylesterase
MIMIDHQATVAQTTLGPIEYAVVGTGAPVLVLHGSPGGIDAAELMARILPRDGVSAILLSRPGYLGTPLAGRTTFDDQADLMAALLDHLGIARAGVYTWSGGGPAGYRLAVRHPDRVTAVVANAACSQAYHLPEQDLATRLMFNTAPGQWLLRVLAAHGGKQYIEGVVADEGDLTHDQLAEITTLELEKITAPTLVVQGTADGDLPPSQGYYAARTIPGAELLSLDTGTHLALYTHPDAAAAQTHVVEFLLAGAGREPDITRAGGRA